MIRESDDTDEFWGEETQHLATFCIICGRKSSNGDQAQSGGYTELQAALKKRKEVGAIEISSPKTGFSTF